MSKCIRCGSESYRDRICHICMKKWTTMRKEVWEVLQIKYGKICNDNLQTIQKEARRLDKLWRKDTNKYKLEIEKLERITE